MTARARSNPRHVTRRRRTTLRIQPRIEGLVRHQVSSAFSREVDRAVEREMARYGGVSRSFVIMTCCAFALGVEDQPDYKEEADDAVR